MNIRHWPTASISALALAAAIAVSGCATSQEDLLPTHGTTMDDIWQGETTGHTGQNNNGDTESDTGHTTDLDRARAGLRRPLPGGDVGATNAAYTRTAANEIHSQFSRLPNPDMTLYIFPHLSGGASEQVPVPGYSTVFPLYDRPYYGQPGEQVEYQAVSGHRSTSR